MNSTHMFGSHPLYVRIALYTPCISSLLFRLIYQVDQHYLLRLALNQSLALSDGFSQATALLAIAAADYKNEKKKIIYSVH